MTDLRSRLERVARQTMPVVLVDYVIPPDDNTFWIPPTQANHGTCGWIRFDSREVADEYKRVCEEITLLTWELPLLHEGVDQVDEQKLKRVEMLLARRDSLAAHGKPPVVETHEAAMNNVQ